MLENGLLNAANLRKEILAEFEQLARNSELYEIRAGANYLAMNVSERTTQSDLDVFKGQLSRLLAKDPTHNDAIAFDAAYARLREALPSSVLPRAQSAVILHSYVPSSREDNNDNEKTPLLGGAVARRKGSK